MPKKPSSTFHLPHSAQSPRVAIVADWLTTYSGAERVVHEFHKMFSEAPIYTSVYNPDTMPMFADADVRTSFIQKIPFANKKHQLFPLLRRKAFERFDFSDYDLVISSSGAEAKGIITSSSKLQTPNSKFQKIGHIPHSKGHLPSEQGTVHVNYCHAPTHYYWSRYEEYLNNPAIGFIDPLAKWYLRQTINQSRGWDYLAAQRPDHMLANSTHIKKEIKKYYEREATVAHPPVDTNQFKLQPSNKKRNGFVIVGRQVHYKRIDLAVKACSELDEPLTVIGDGPMHQYLRSIAGSKVTFIRGASNEEVVKHMSHAKALIFPGLDDFGITPVEAMACGTPVIAYGAGGALDTVTSKTGILFPEQTTASLAQALTSFKTDSFDPSTVRHHALRFSAENFQKNVTAFLKSVGF